MQHQNRLVKLSLQAQPSDSESSSFANSHSSWNEATAIRHRAAVPVLLGRALREC